jgi:Protein of unknown function (DUF3592)
MWRVSPERLLNWLPRLFLGIGVVLLVVAAVVGVFTARFVASSERTVGTVIDLSRSEDSEGSVTYSPVVRFTVDGRTIQFTSSSGSSSPPSVGDRIEVLYDPDDPTDARLAGFLDLWLFPLIAGLIGAGFITVSAIIIRRTRAPSAKDVEWLRTHGRHVQGRSPRSVYCGDVTVQESSPFRVEVDVDEPERNQVRVLASEYVWFDPAPYLEDRESLDVYVDPEDRECYLVDVAFLPSRAE